MRIHPWEILDRASFERLRPAYRRFVIGHKFLRRVRIDPSASVLFETRATVLWQIHEILRCEGAWSDARIAREIATYEGLVPRPGELAMTLMVDGGETDASRALCRAIRGAENVVQIQIGDRRLPGRSFDGLADLDCPVHYLRFTLDADAADRIDDYRWPMWLTVRGGEQQQRVAVSLLVRAQLAEDLRRRAAPTPLIERWVDRLVEAPTAAVAERAAYPEPERACAS